METTAKHTPGPQEVKRNIGVALGSDRLKYIIIADAKLYAAAPKLNRTLQAIAAEAEFTADDGAMDLGEKLLRIQKLARAAAVTVTEEEEDDDAA